MHKYLSYQVEFVESETTSTAYAGVPLLVEAFLRLVSRQRLVELAQATGILIVVTGGLSLSVTRLLRTGKMRRAGRSLPWVVIESQQERLGGR